MNTYRIKEIAVGVRRVLLNVTGMGTMRMRVEWLGRFGSGHGVFSCFLGWLESGNRRG
jgi:hypothetical protein